jgi:hypothetical protein
MSISDFKNIIMRIPLILLVIFIPLNLFSQINYLNNEPLTVKDIVVQKKDSRLSDNYFIKNKNKYISIGFGMGANYGGTVGLRFQQRFGGKIGLGYHAGIGYWLINKEYNLSTLAYAFGIKLFWFKGLYLNIEYDINSGYYFENAGENLQIWDGVSYLVGCDWFFTKYCGINFALGINQILNDDKDIWRTMSLGIIFKFK